MELIEIVKKRLEAKGWGFNSDYFDDEELNSLHEVILETEAALRQPPVVGQSEQFSLAELWKMAQKYNCDDFIKMVQEIKG